MVFLFFKLKTAFAFFMVVGISGKYEWQRSFKKQTFFISCQLNDWGCHQYLKVVYCGPEIVKVNYLKY